MKAEPARPPLDAAAQEAVDRAARQLLELAYDLLMERRRQQSNRQPEAGAMVQ